MTDVSAAPATTRVESRRERISLLSLVTFLTVGLADSQLVAPILPVIALGLGTGVEEIGTSVTFYSVAAAAAALTVGPSSDRFGRKLFLLAAGGLFAIASAVGASAGNLTMFFGARMLAGAAAGVISALVVAGVAYLVPYERRGRAMSWVAIAYFAAPILIVPLAASMTERYGWRPNYWAFGVASILATLLLAAGYNEDRGVETTPPAADNGWFGRYRGLLSTRSLVAGAGSAFFVSGGFAGFMLYLGAYLISRFGLSVPQVALVFLVCGGFGVLGAFGAGRLADRIGKKSVAIGSSVVLAMTLFSVPFIAGWPLYAVLALTGLAALSRVAPLQSLVTELVSAKKRASYVAIRNTLSQMGIGTTALVGAKLYPIGFDRICWLAGGMSLGAVGLLLLIREPEEAEPTG